MNEPILHQRESSEDTESFLKENGEKFNRQCVQVLQLLYQGKRLAAKEVNDILDIADGGRRLRDIFASRKDCKREWIKGEDGKRKGVKYWLEGISPPTKHSTIAKAEAVILQMKAVAPKEFVTVMNIGFSPHDEKENAPKYIQEKLFE